MDKRRSTTLIHYDSASLFEPFDLFVGTRPLRWEGDLAARFMDVCISRRAGNSAPIAIGQPEEATFGRGTGNGRAVVLKFSVAAAAMDRQGVEAVGERRGLTYYFDPRDIGSAESGGGDELHPDSSRSIRMKPLSQATFTFLTVNTLGTDIQGVPVNGVATVQLNEVLLGTHQMSAQYSGDQNNNSSQTNGSINQVVLGQAHCL